jgi:aryl-alcohol dehydrogenase-like predicted oxidoreductase
MTYGGYAQDEESFACMKKAYDLGINFFDTAENYTAGQAEIVMGKALKHFGWKRSDLVISTSKLSHRVRNVLYFNTGGQRLTGVLSMARFLSTTMACHESTSSRDWRLP